MTVSISQLAYDELFNEMIQVESTRHPDPHDKKDFMGNFPPVLGQGFWRTIALRDWLEIVLGNLQIGDRFSTAHPEGETDWLELHLHLSGVHEYRNFSSDGTEYSPEVFRVGYDLEHKFSENWPFLCSERNAASKFGASSYLYKIGTTGRN